MDLVLFATAGVTQQEAKAVIDLVTTRTGFVIDSYVAIKDTINQEHAVQLRADEMKVNSDLANIFYRLAGSANSKYKVEDYSKFWTSYAYSMSNNILIATSHNGNNPIQNEGINSNTEQTENYSPVAQDDYSVEYTGSDNQEETEYNVDRCSDTDDVNSAEENVYEDEYYNPNKEPVNDTTLDNSLTPTEGCDGESLSQNVDELSPVDDLPSAESNDESVTANSGTSAVSDDSSHSGDSSSGGGSAHGGTSGSGGRSGGSPTTGGGSGSPGDGGGTPPDDGEPPIPPDEPPPTPPPPPIPPTDGRNQARPAAQNESSQSLPKSSDSAAQTQTPSSQQQTGQNLHKNDGDSPFKGQTQQGKNLPDESAAKTDNAHNPPPPDDSYVPPNDDYYAPPPDESYYPPPSDYDYPPPNDYYDDAPHQAATQSPTGNSAAGQKLNPTPQNKSGGNNSGNDTKNNSTKPEQTNGKQSDRQKNAPPKDNS